MVFTQRAFTGVVTEPNTGELSNMITNKDGDILFYRFKSDDAYSGIKKWSNPAATTGTSSPNGKGFIFKTKDFTFGNIADRKKIYKVYVTYKTTDSSDSKVVVHAGINGVMLQLPLVLLRVDLQEQVQHVIMQAMVFLIQVEIGK